MSALDRQAAKVIEALANLVTVEKSLRFLASVGVVREEAVVKGCHKFVKDHPEIQAWIDSDAFMTDLGANAEVRGASRLVGEASSAEGATSTAELERGHDGERK